ncbi:MAG: MerR family DNA-binding transcriptional regulator [Prochlorococcaceae cyanobacterium]
MATPEPIRAGGAGERPQKIGEVARRSGLTVKTVRFYCDEGLIQPIGRSEGGYRLFDQSIYAELALIRSLKAIEIPLGDVRRIMAARRSGVCTCDALKGMMQIKLGEIEQTIARFDLLRGELSSLLAGWHPCGGQPADAAGS